MKLTATDSRGRPLPPCTRCGDCCRAGLCHVAIEVGFAGPPCSMLRSDNRCQLWMTAWGLHFTEAREELAIGLGCTNEDKVGIIRVVAGKGGSAHV